MLRKECQEWLAGSSMGTGQGRGTRERVLDQLVMSAMSTGRGNFPQGDVCTGDKVVAVASSSRA